MPQAVEIAPHGAEPRVHLLAAVIARIAEREASVGVDFGIAEADEPVGDVDVAVLDDDVAVAGAPDGVERAQTFAGEIALDARMAERAGHDAVEFAPPAEGDRMRGRSEVRHDPRQQLIAFLPVGARHVKPDSRTIAVPRRTAERDVRALGREASIVERHVIGSVLVGDLAGNRQVRRQRNRREGTPVVAGAHRGREALRRRNHEAPLAAMFREFSERPFERVPPVGRSGEPLSGQLLEIGELGEIDAGQRRIESRRRPRLRAKRLDRVSELRVTAVELRAGVPDVERRLRPPQRSVERRELVVVEAERRAPERAGEISAAALEQRERAIELAVAGETPALVLPEDLAHARKVHARLDLVDLVRPVGEVDVAPRHTLRAVALQIDPLEVHASAVEHELRFHVRPHRHVVLNGDRAAVKRGGAAVLRHVAHRDVEVGADDAPRRLVILEGELAAVGAQPPHRDGEATRLLRPVVVAREAGKVVRVLPFLDEHLPVGHLDAGDRDIRLARERGQPVERDGNAFGREERAIALVHSVDRQVLDDDAAGEDVDAERADVDRPLEVFRSAALGEPAHRRPEIDRERHDDRGREQRDDHRARIARVSQDLVLAETFHECAEAPPPALLTRALRSLGLTAVENFH